MKPAVFAMPPGADFPRLLVQGLRRRMADQSPEAMARVELIVNTARMRRRITDLFVAEGPGFLPRLRLVTELGSEIPLPGQPPAIPPLRRRLELSQLVSRLLDSAPDLAPRSAIFDLSDSLATLMDEMRGEGVSPEVIAALDVADHSAHWQRTRKFMAIVAPLMADDSAPDTEARQRRVIEHLVRHWQTNPPAHPVIIAGSTGSRGTTALLMQAVARLPRGMLILPGFDFEMPETVWAAMEDEMASEDHPQYRFRRLMTALNLSPGDIQRWEGAVPAAADRNRLISLSLRPAPVTDQWRVEGPLLPDLAQACRDVTLIEAADPRTEALAIALALRGAVENNARAALVTPDRGLARQVSAALDRWGIIPDDSAGRPLALSPPGRFLRHVARLSGSRITTEALLTLMKHPLTASGGENRGSHLRLTRELELWLRRRAAPFPDARLLNQWAAQEKDPFAKPWADWLIKSLTAQENPGPRPLSDHVARHLELAALLARGPDGTGTGRLWQEPAGQMAKTVTDELVAEAPHGGSLTSTDYQHLFDAVIAGAEVREDFPVHPGIMIWGTLEARVQGADLVILGGLNDGTWPQLPAPDPWMNRRMRRDAGLLLPDRRIGLSAHDYQQAVAAPAIILSRSLRDGEAQTVPSRWLSRLLNLMEGLPGPRGPEALNEMRERGAYWLSLADALERPAGPPVPAPRPAPAPPLAARPRELPVTAIKTLIRDPYSVYARHILRLRKLDPLHPAPDALLRGQVLHKVLEQFVRDRPDAETREAARQRLSDLTRRMLQDEIPWAAARLMWQSRLDKVADFFLDHDRALGGHTVVLEQPGRMTADPPGFTLQGRPDRIDRLADGRLHILDYKTGTPPTEKEQRLFDKQLLLLAAMAEGGAFPDLGPVEVAKITYLGLGSKPKAVTTDTSPGMLEDIREGFLGLIAAYLSPEKGFTARRALQKEGDVSDYDHLSRFGEWDASTPATVIKVGQ